MAKKTKRKTKAVKEAKTTSSNLSAPWLSLRSGIIILVIVSLGMAALTAWQASHVKPWPEAILWGLVFGGSVWIVFLSVFLFQRLMRKFR